MVPFKIYNVTFKARNFSILFKNSSSSNPVNMRSMYPAGYADIHLMNINRNITPGNKEFSLLRNMRFLQVMTTNFTVFWHVTPCFFSWRGESNLLTFRRICCFHFQGKGTKFIYLCSWLCYNIDYLSLITPEAAGECDEFRWLILCTGLKMRNTKLTKCQQ